MIFAFISLMICGCLLCLGSQLTKAIWFPIGFLFLMVPLPSSVMAGIEVFLQYASAEAAHVLFKLFGTPVFREGLVFTLPGLVIEVAQECSGIRSTLVLLITGILSGQLFLCSPWSRAILTLAVVPIGIVRNAFRIVTIALLTIHVDPQTIHGPIHKKGGPIFFILSLVAFFALLFLLRRFERPKKQVSNV
jgi:exosortase C (VPDSG-CTERM-specific)